MPNHGFKTGEEVAYLASRSGGVASPLADLLSGDRFYVVAIDDSHLQLVREPAVDVNLDGFAPYDPQAPNPSQQTLSGFRNVLFNSSTAVDLATDRITVSSSSLANLNEIVEGMTVSYYHASDDDEVTPVAIGGLAGGSSYVVKNRTVQGGSAVSFQLAPVLSPNQIIDLTSAGVDGDHLLRFSAPDRSFIPQVAVNPGTDEFTITNHGWQTGDEVVYQVDPSITRTSAIQKTALLSKELTVSVNPTAVDDMSRATVTQPPTRCDTSVCRVWRKARRCAT